MKTKPTILLRKLAAMLAMPAAFSLLFNSQAHAGAFTPGNVVVIQYGDGSAALSAVAAPVVALEYLPTTAGQTTPVQSIAIPSTGANRLTVVGSSTSEGFVTRSTTSSAITFEGYDADAGTAALAGTTATAVNRYVGQLDVNGNFIRTAGGSTVAFSGSNIRSSASDGVNYWMAGTASTSATGGGVWYSAAGGVPIHIGNGNANGNVRVTRIYNGNLYVSTGSGTLGVWAYTGIPTAAATAANVINTTTSSPYDFAINPAGNVAYVCDDSTLANGGGIQKWTNNGTAWSFLYTFGTGAGLTAGCRGLAVDFSGGTPVIYATTADTATKLITITDTGSTATATVLATAPALTAFRGVALAPAAQTSGAPVITGISPAGTTNSSGTPVSFTVSATGSSPFSYFWFKEIPGVSTNLIPSATSAILAFPSAAPSDSASYQVIVSNAFSPPATSSVVSLLITDAPPSILSITPVGITNAAGSAASFTVSASGSQPLSYFWYKEIPGVSTNLITGATGATLLFSSTAVSDSAVYQVAVSNLFSPPVATSSVVTLLVTSAPPVITGISPSITTNAGLTATFTVTNTGTPPFTYFWLQEIGGTTNVFSITTNNTLSIPNLVGTEAGNYQVIVSNTLAVTSSVVTLTVTDDPHITAQPGNANGLLDGTVHFAVGAIGSGLTYQWFFADASGNIIGPVIDGSYGAASTISGSHTSLLTIANVQADSPTNFVVQVTGTFGGPLTSTVASLTSVANTGAVIAFWDFNGTLFTNLVENPNSFNSPAPFVGVGTASAIGTANIPPTSPFSGSVDPNDGVGFTTHLPPFSWGTSTYPTNGNPALNKTAGVQFNVSTVGAKNIKFSYDVRGTGTASKYSRLQYTTNGTDWIDYPSSSAFNSVVVGYFPFSYDLTGFPGVANNPSFAVRIVTEYMSTATYGISTTNAFVGVANNYGVTGTLTYDLVTFTGDAITNNNQPPMVSTFTNVNMVDFMPYTNSFTVSDDSTPQDSLSYNAVSLNTSSFNASFEFQGTGANRSLIIHPFSIGTSTAAAPILVTVTDANGDSTVLSFIASVSTVNLPPTNSLTKLTGTNAIANHAIAIPFSVGDDRTPASGLTYSTGTGNSTVVPGANISITGVGTANPVLHVLPGTNQLGVGVVNVTVNDNDAQAAKSTTASIPFVVRPNTNIVSIDYFNYDTAGALDAQSGGFWQHLSGNLGQMQVNNGVVTIDTFNQTENLQTPLLGAPYSTNSGTVLYASFIVSMQNPGNMPLNNGTYFTAFNDGSGTTANVEGQVVVSTNGAVTPGDYFLGIANLNGANGTNSTTFPMELQPFNNYVVVVQLVVSNAIATLWINPESQSSPSVTDTHIPPKFNISDFEFRSSGANGGAISVSKLKVGTSFDSVFPALHVQAAGSNVIVNWSDPTLGIQSTPDLTVPFTDVPGAQPPYTNSMGSVQFFKFGQ